MKEYSINTNTSKKKKEPFFLHTVRILEKEDHKKITYVQNVLYIIRVSLV